MGTVFFLSAADRLEAASSFSKDMPSDVSAKKKLQLNNNPQSDQPLKVGRFCFAHFWERSYAMSKEEFEKLEHEKYVLCLLYTSDAADEL